MSLGLDVFDSDDCYGHLLRLDVLGIVVYTGWRNHSTSNQLNDC